MNARLYQLYEEAADAKTAEHLARRHSAAKAEEWRRRYRAIVDEIHKLNLERKRQERLDEAERGAGRKEAPPPRTRSSKGQWWHVLGVHPHAGRDEVNRVYRNLALKHPPDAGGSVEAMARINAARDQALGR